MSYNFKKFVTGIRISAVSPSVLTGDTLGDLQTYSGDNNLYFNDGSSNSPLATASNPITFSNKIITGNSASNLINGAGTIDFNSSGTVTVPNATDTLVGKNTTDTLTNKTLTGNLIASFTPDGTHTLTAPLETSTLATQTGTETLTNKTLTSPVIASFTPDGTHTLTAPLETATLATQTGTETLTNKTIAAGSNTISGLTNSNLSGSAGITYANLDVANSIEASDINSQSSSGGTTLTSNGDGTASFQASIGFSSGMLMPFAGSSIPTGWLNCDGSAVSRSTYAALFSAVSTTWGSGDGSTTFNLPDLRGQTVIGAGTGTGLTPRTLGTTYIGEEAHLNTSAESGVPSHIHTMGSHIHTMGNHTHGHPPGVGGGQFVVTNTGGGGYGNGGSILAHFVGADNTDGPSTNNTDGPSTNNTDANSTANASNAHNTMQPSAVVNYIIKT